MGKTLLVEELAAKARAAAVTVTVGWCREDAAKPYEPSAPVSRQRLGTSLTYVPGPLAVCSFA